MELWILLVFGTIHVISWLVFLIIQKNIGHVTSSHVRILGKENIQLIKTRGLLVARIVYFSFLVVLFLSSFLLLHLYLS